jgi:serine/threonine-protein phosphatase 2A regulatory subunit B''
MSDVNEPTSLFNYQHFYVAFCHFWDLDTDGDGLLSKDDLLKFNDGALAPIICDRLMNFAWAPRAFGPGPLIDFRTFSYLIMCTEDKTNVTSVTFWFRLCDLDDDGVLSIDEIARLYEQQNERLAVTGNETIPFADVFRQLIDAVRPENHAALTLADLIASRQAVLFFNTLVDLKKFLQQEYQVPEFEQPTDELRKKLTPWEYFALSEYEALANDAE